MPRHVKTLTIHEDKQGYRDNDKTFIITEMPADQGERWATQVGYLIAQAGRQVPEGALDAGMAGLAAIGIDFQEVAIARALQDPSVEEATWSCVQYMHDPKHAPQPIFSGDNCQIDEIKTRTALRMEVLKLHLNFSVGAEPQNSARKPRRVV